MARNTRRKLSAAITLIGTIAIALVLASWGSYWRAFAQGAPLPSATVKVWDGVGNGLGLNPDQSRADFTGVTAQVATTAAPLTIVTVYENTICPGGPCGITFWNPVTNVFKCFGVTGGFQAASAINLTGAVKTSTSPSPATFQPGDAWASGPTGVPIYAVFKGTSRFRGYSVGSPFGITVDQRTGDIFFAQDAPGAIQKLDPATNMRTSWAVGGLPRYIAQDAARRVFVTVDGLNQIVRLDPATNGVTRWVVPTPGALGSAGVTPDGITVDADGNVWFAESGASKIGRLSAGPDGVLGTAADVICEFTKSGLVNPQLVESTGSDAPAVFAAKNLQVFFTEGAGNAVGIVTQKEALGGASSVFSCTTVPPSVSTVMPTTDTVSAFDFTRTPTIVTITPTTFTIPGVNGMTDATGTTRTSAGERIPGILRFPLGSTGNSGPSGLTQVAAANTVFGSFFSTHRLWGVTSAAIIPPPPGDVVVRSNPISPDNPIVSFNFPTDTYTVAFASVLTPFDMTVTRRRRTSTAVMAELAANFPLGTDCIHNTADGSNSCAQYEVAITGTDAPPIPGTHFSGKVKLQIAFSTQDVVGNPGMAHAIFGSPQAPSFDEDILTDYINKPGPDPIGSGEADSFQRFLMVNKPLTQEGTFCGFQPPLPGGTFPSRRTLPVKFALTAGDCSSGNFITDAVVQLSVAKLTDTGAVLQEVMSAGGANVGNFFRYDFEENHYIFDLKLDGFSSGTYLATVHGDKLRPQSFQFAVSAP